MKTFGVIHFIIFLILMLAYQCVPAQDFAVTTKGDTLFGVVKPIAYGVDKKVQVTGNDRKKTILGLTQVKAFTLKGETFKPVKGPGGYSFMKLLKSGYVSLFAFQLENQTTYDGRFLVKRDGTGTEVPNLSFKKIMTRFLEDCPEVSEQIENGTFAKRELDIIIDRYNQCIDAKTEAREKVVATRVEQVKKISSWDVLEEKVKAESDFEGKTNALEMIGEIKSKIAKGEKVPNFLSSGLKSVITQPSLQEALQNALKEIE